MFSLTIVKNLALYRELKTSEIQNNFCSRMFPHYTPYSTLMEVGFCLYNYYIFTFFLPKTARILYTFVMTNTPINTPELTGSELLRPRLESLDALEWSETGLDDFPTDEVDLVTLLGPIASEGYFDSYEPVVVASGQELVARWQTMLESEQDLGPNHLYLMRKGQNGVSMVAASAGSTTARPDDPEIFPGNTVQVLNIDGKSLHKNVLAKAVENGEELRLVASHYRSDN